METPAIISGLQEGSHAWPQEDVCIRLEVDEIEQLRRIVAACKSSQSKMLRARVVLACHEHPDWSDEHVAREVDCSAGMVRKWRRRWVTTQSLEEAPRSGRPRVAKRSP